MKKKTMNIKNKGTLHRKLNVPSDEKIPMAKINKAITRAKRNKDTKLEREAVFAKNVKEGKFRRRGRR